MTLLQTDFLPNKSETFQAFRYLLQGGGIQPGVVAATDFKVVQRGAGANMSVDIGAGDAWLNGTSVARQGIYHQTNDAVVNTVVTAADATNPRLDQVLLVVNDSAIAGASDNPAFVIVAGTPTAGTTLDNRNGAVSPATMNATWPNRLLIGDLLIPAASTSVVTANIRDRRPWARGAFWTKVYNAGGLTTTSTSAVPLDSTGLPAQRVECSGLPLRLLLKANFNNSGGAVNGQINTIHPFVDSALPAALIAASVVRPFDTNNWTTVLEWIYTPAVGSHTIQPYWAVSGGTGGIPAGQSTEFTIEELFRQNANNT